MRIGFAAVGVALLLLAGGCCDSAQPLYTPETLKADLDLAGTWQGYDPERKKLEVDKSMTVEALGPGEFKVRLLEGVARGEDIKREDCTAVVRAVEIEGKPYLDISQIEPEGGFLGPNEHLIFAVKLDGDQLLIANLDSGKVQKCAKEAKVKYVANGWFRGHLDAPTADLQKFIAHYRKDIFILAGESRRIAKAPAAD